MPKQLGRANAAAIATVMACKPLPVFAHHLAFGCVRLLGNLAPVGRSAASPIVPELGAILAVIQTEIGGLDGFAVSSRRQADRRAFLVLAYRQRRPFAFLKIAEAGQAGGFDAEHACLSGLARPDAPMPSSPVPDSPVLVPTLLGAGEFSGMRWTAMSALPPRPHRPAKTADVGTIVDWFQSKLAGRLPGVAPTGWVPIHGDFAPWNLRRLFGAGLTLFDFEDARYGPADADTTFWHLAVATLRGKAVIMPMRAETLMFWEEFLSQRIAAAAKPELDLQLLATLRGAATAKRRSRR